MDFLKKIGLLKSGGTSWSGDAKDAPIDVDGIPVDQKQEAPAEPQAAAPEPPAE